MSLFCLTYSHPILCARVCLVVHQTKQALLRELEQSCTNVTVMGSKEVPWFPRKMADIDLISQNVLGAGAELESDHPGFHDQVCVAAAAASLSTLVSLSLPPSLSLSLSLSL